MELKKPNIKHHNRLKKVFLPNNMSEDLAELIGIHFGDGSLHKDKKSTYKISYCFNIKEKELIKKTKNIFKNIFDLNLKASFQKEKNAVSIQCCSKEVSMFIHENFGAPLGKKDNLRIPRIILDNQKYLIAFLKGLHATDGCIFIKNDRKYRYPVFKITTKCEKFSQEIHMALINLGFRATINQKFWKNLPCYDVVLHGNKQVDMWKNLINYKGGDAGI